MLVVVASSAAQKPHPAEQCAVADIENKIIFINITHTLDTITYHRTFWTVDWTILSLSSDWQMVQSTVQFMEKRRKMTEKRRKGRNLMYNVKRCEEEEERDTEKKTYNFVTTMLSIVRICYSCAWSIRPYFYEKNGFTTIRYNLYFNKN